MNRLFGSAVDAQPRTGDSSLTGHHRCKYCREPCAQSGRFQVPNELVWVSSLCTPECAAGYSRFCVVGTAEERRHRHQQIEERYGRRIQVPPSPLELVAGSGIPRSMWLPRCHEQLDEEEMALVERERLVLRVELNRHTNIQGKK